MTVPENSKPQDAGQVNLWELPFDDSVEAWAGKVDKAVATITTEAVSYTHLVNVTGYDYSAGEGIFALHIVVIIAGGDYTCGLYSVSYTHLDVYKRQALHSSGNFLAAEKHIFTSISAPTGRAFFSTLSGNTKCVPCS